MENRKLFLVQHPDCPLYVLAENWQQAVERWKAKISNVDDLESVGDPKNVSLIADTDEILF
jgi:hypothetical protein